MLNLKRAFEEDLCILASLFRHIRTSLCRRAADLEDRLQLSAIGMWMHAGKHFDNQTAKRPDICFASVGGLLDNFGCHPEDGALERDARACAFAGGGNKKTGGFNALANAEITDLDTTVVVDEDVGALNIAMDDVLGMQVCQSRKDLSDKVCNQWFTERTIVDEHGGDRTTSDILEENVEVRIVRVGSEILYDVGMLKLAQKSDLSFESLHHVVFLGVEVGA